MAVISPTMTYVPGQLASIAGWKATVSNLTQTTTDTSSALYFPDYSDRSVVVTGTFGSNGAVTIEGSNDNSTWATVSDPNGNALNITATAIKAITEASIYLRAHVSTGDTTTSLTCTFFFRKTGAQ